MDLFGLHMVSFCDDVLLVMGLWDWNVEKTENDLARSFWGNI